MKTTLKKSLAILMCLVMLLGVAPLNGLVGLELPDISGLFNTKASAVENNSGTMASGTGWILYNDGELVISENLNDFTYKNKAVNGYNMVIGTPWASTITSIKKAIVEEGVTHLPSLCFAECVNLTYISLPSTLSSMGSGCFYNCESLKKIDPITGILGVQTFLSNL